MERQNKQKIYHPGIQNLMVVFFLFLFFFCCLTSNAKMYRRNGSVPTIPGAATLELKYFLTWKAGTDPPVCRFRGGALPLNRYGVLRRESRWPSG